MVNRAFILLAVLFSLLIPVIDIPLQEEVLPITYTFTLQELSIQAASPQSGFSWEEILLAMYCIPCLLLLGRLLYQVGKLYYFSQTKALHTNKGYRLVPTEGNYPTFSFFHVIFWDNSQTLSEEGKVQILQHELTHMRQWHSADIIFLEIVKAMFWFHPAIYLFKRDLQEVHEYLADEAVVKKHNTGEYIQLLIHQTFKKAGFSFASSFNQSQTKNRIIMLTKLKNAKRATWKVALVLPVIALLTFMYSCDSNESEKLEPTTQLSADATEADILNAYKSKYPDIAIDAVHVTKKPDGESDIKITVKNVNDPDDKHKIEDQLSQQATKNFSKIKFESLVELKATSPRVQYGKEIFSVVEQMPEPEGGLEKLFTYFGENLKYPSEARTNGIEGKVFIQFIVNKDGSISDVQVLKGLGYGLDAEAVRVVKNMPAWKPGMQKGQPVNVRMSLPLAFKLN